MPKPRALWEEDRRRLASRMHAVARAQSVEDQRLFGQIAWGRYDGEPSASDDKDNVVFGCGYLNGYRDAMMRVAEVMKLPMEAALRRIHEGGWHRIGD